MRNKDISQSVMVFHGGQVESFLTKPNIQSRIFRLDEKFRKMLFKCKVSIAVSDALRNSFIKIIPELKEYMFVVPHGIDIDLFRPISEDIIVLIRQRYGLERYHYVIISSSRLVEKKGQDYLLIAYSKLRSLYPNVRIIIAGDGSYRSQLEKLCTELNIRNEVKFAGQLDRKKLAQLIAASDLSVMLSRIPYEAFGIVNIEANACGVPVLSTNMAGVPDSIEDGITGLLVNPLDIDEIIHALKKLINKKYLKKFKENTVKKIYRNNTNIVMAQKTLELVNSTNPKI